MSDIWTAVGEALQDQIDAEWDHQQQQEAQRRDQDELRQIRRQKELEQLAFDHGLKDPKFAAEVARCMPKIIDAMADCFLAGYEAAVDQLNESR